MTKLIDFKCRYAEFSGQIDLNNLPRYPVFPSDPVLEAEGFGAAIKYDDSALGHRKDHDVVSSIEQLSDLPELDVSHGRIKETLELVKKINDTGGCASVELQGPVTILNGLADIMKIFLGWRKRPDLMDEFFEKVSHGLVEYALSARDAGCRIIYYSDSPGSLNIIGPKFAKQLTDNFTAPFLTELSKKLGNDCVIHLCPKTSFLLTGCNKANWSTLHLPKKMSYTDACFYACGKVSIIGQRCRKDTDITVSSLHFLEMEK